MASLLGSPILNLTRPPGIAQKSRFQELSIIRHPECLGAQFTWVALQIILVIVVILWPGSVTYWIERGIINPSKMKIEIPMPDLPPPLDFSEPPKMQ